VEAQAADARALPSVSVGVFDPALGGTLRAPLGELSLVVPVGVYADMLTISFGFAGPPPGSPNAANLLVGGGAYVVTVVDSTGANVRTFDQPLTLVFTPSEADLAAANGEASAIVVAVYNSETDAFDAVPTTVNDDGTVSVLLGSLGVRPPPA
jgi:hypothetical protein